MYSFLKNLLSPCSGELNILSAFKPMYITLSVFGLLLYSLKFPETQEGAIIIHKSIYFNLLCSVSIILLLYSSCVIHVQQVFDSETSTMTEVLMTKMNYLLELFGVIVFSTVTHFYAFKNKFSYVKILNAIVSSNNSIVDYSKGDSLRELYVEVKMITGSLCLLLAIQLTISFTRHETVWRITLVTITFILPQMIQFTLISFYYVLVVMVVGILKNINEQLIDFVQARTFNASKFSKTESQTVYFHLMETVFVKILETKREINKAFQASILATVIQWFHSLISETYVIYHGLFIQTETIKIHNIINCLTWIGYQLLKINMISRTGILLKGQITKIGRNLHNIPTEKEDTRLYFEIQHFSTLIMYQNAELTVYDYFPLDATLMFNIITSAAMYLIILVQFDE